MDPPRHSRYRAQVNPHFKPAVVKELESDMRTFAKGLADGFVGGGACDLVRDFAAKISIRGACTVGGLPVEEVDTMAGWVNGIFHRRKGHRGSTEVGEQAGKDMFVFILDWVKKHRVNPERATGILETLLTTEVDGALMDDFQVASTLSVVLIGGTDTLPKALGATFYRLWKNPDQRAAVVADPSLIPNAFLEALRIDTPTQMLGRTCTREIEYHDETVKPGQKVMFLWASANRDEREFENPDVYDITRHPQRMLAFGQGVHMCIGHHVAKLEARIALEEILSRVPEYEIQEGQCERARTEFVQGWLKLPVSFAPA
jgi:cytochrome P450